MLRINFIFLLIVHITFFSVSSEKLTLMNGKVTRINLPFKDITEIVIGHPDIVDVQIGGQNYLYIFGKTVGKTNIHIAGKTEKNHKEIEVTITEDVEQSQKHIKKLTKEDVQIEHHSKGIILSGKVKSSDELKSIEAYANSLLKEKDHLINNIKISTPAQIYLKVRIAEVNKTVLNEMGFAWETLVRPFDGTFKLGVATGRDILSGSGTINRSGDLNNPGSLYISRNSKDVLNVVLDALESEDFASILAQPTLVASSGEDASFLVGGELPYPVSKNQSISVEFKEFGVKLSFKPIIVSDDYIHLRVKPEVSEPDYTNVVTLPLSNNNTITIPAIKTRRAETSLNLQSGQSLAIAGLFSSKIKNNIKEFPGLSEIPILGALFTSSSYKSEESELVIVVTPYIVSAASENEILLPTDTIAHTTPSYPFKKTFTNNDKLKPYLGD